MADNDDKIWTRRQAVGTLGALAAGTLLFGCTTADDSGDSATDTSGSGDDTGGALDSCEEADDTTAGPYPDTVGMVNDEAYYRSDVTEGLYPSAVPLALTLQLVDKDSCVPLSGYTLEIWHCDPSGNYSEYSGQPGGYDGTGETYLRGLQITDDDGKVTFSSIYPGWYIPRTTHIHIKVYKDGSVIKTTQIGFPDTLNEEVNNSSGYGGPSSFNNTNDQVFVDEGDGADDNLCAVSGGVDSGVTATYVVGV